MAVQYQNSVPARSDARFSTTSSHQQRAPDLVLQPCQEGVDFSLRLVQANRMSKVVEIQCCCEDEEKKGATPRQLTEDDIQNLFVAIGGNENEEEEDLEEVDIADDYQPKDTAIYSGLPHLESLSIIGNDDSPSFLRPLIRFLSVSGSFPRFTRLSLQGVNLRGDLLEFRALAEAFRLHPHVQHVHMVACWFTPEQQANMGCLEDVFQKQQQPQPSSAASQRASILQMRQLVLEHAGAIKNDHVPPATVDNAQSKQTVAVEQSPVDEMWWGERLLRSCFCFW
jgi:hypothetical protein